MRTNLGLHKKELVARAEHDLPRLLVNYEPTNLKHLGRICECLCQIDEYLQSPHGRIAAAKEVDAMLFLKTEYRERIVLVLASQEKSNAFTLYDIARFVRGESIHGTSDNRDKRRALLHSFIFETDKNAKWQFIYAWNWIAGPNIGAEESNHDSNGPFIHAITLNERRIEAGLAESIILRGAYEFWQALSKGTQRQTTKTFLNSFRWNTRRFSDLRLQHESTSNCSRLGCKSMRPNHSIERKPNRLRLVTTHVKR